MTSILIVCLELRRDAANVGRISSISFASPFKSIYIHFDRASVHTQQSLLEMFCQQTYVSGVRRPSRGEVTSAIEVACLFVEFYVSPRIPVLGRSIHTLYRSERFRKVSGCFWVQRLPS